jgi:phenylacetate-CoA ligase
MARLAGRVDDMLIIRGVNLYPSEVERVLLTIESIAPHYQLVLSRDTALDHLEVQAEVAGHVAAGWDESGEEPKRVRELGDVVRHRLLDETGIRMRVRLRPPGALPRSEGKAVRVLDLRAQ